MAKAPGTWLAPVKIAPNARLRGSDDRKPEDPPRASHRSPRGAADDRRPALAQHQTLGRTAQGRGGGRGQRWLADDRRGARALQPDARGIRLVAARGRSLGHAGPQGHPHPALPRPLRAPAQVLIPSTWVRPRRGERILASTVYSGQRADSRAEQEDRS